jgi:hypothetical protein
MFNPKSIFSILHFPFSILLTIPLATSAESVKMVHWWDAYFPSKEEKATYSYRSASPYFIQYQDVNRDGVYNDTLVWYEFSTQYPFNPQTERGDEDNPSPNYRLHRPSARFYGGMVARFTNVSHITKKEFHSLIDSNRPPCNPPKARNLVLIQLSIPTTLPECRNMTTGYPGPTSP